MGDMRIGLGPLVALCGGVVLLVSLFVTWYDASFAGQVQSYDAWQAFSVISLLLYVAGVMAIAYGALDLIDRLPRLGVSAGAVICGAGIVALALVVFRLVVAPDLEPGIGAQVSVTGGAFVGLVGCLVIVAGGYLGIAGTLEWLQSRLGLGGTSSTIDEPQPSSDAETTAREASSETDSAKERATESVKGSTHSHAEESPQSGDSVQG